MACRSSRSADTSNRGASTSLTPATTTATSGRSASAGSSWVARTSEAVRPRTAGGAVIGIERGFALESADGRVTPLPPLWTDAGVRMKHYMYVMRRELKRGGDGDASAAPLDVDATADVAPAACAAGTASCGCGK